METFAVPYRNMLSKKQQCKQLSYSNACRCILNNSHPVETNESFGIKVQQYVVGVSVSGASRWSGAQTEAPAGRQQTGLQGDPAEDSIKLTPRDQGSKPAYSTTPDQTMQCYVASHPNFTDCDRGQREGGREEDREEGSKAATV